MLSFLPALIALLIQGSPEPSSSLAAVWLSRGPHLEQHRVRSGAPISAGVRQQEVLRSFLSTRCGDAMLTAYGPLIQEIFEAALREPSDPTVADLATRSAPSTRRRPSDEDPQRPTLGFRSISRPRDGPAL
jgi:hypothetical protein